MAAPKPPPLRIEEEQEAALHQKVWHEAKAVSQTPRQGELQHLKITPKHQS